MVWGPDPDLDNLAGDMSWANPYACDNCPIVFNPSQINSDPWQDDMGDMCDSDCDGDGWEFDDFIDADGDGYPLSCDPDDDNGAVPGP